MQKVISVNLNGLAYQLEEQGYAALVAYLERAEAQLADNPDRVEIMLDLEQAIGDKCARYLGPHKTVVAAGDIGQILEQMGPVDPAPGGEGPSAARAGETKTGKDAPRRLYQIRSGAMLAGVCNGLAAYFNIDVTIVRLVFVLLAVVTQGAWVFAYVLFMFVIPEARTSEEHAAAYGQPFSAQDLINEAKKSFSDFKNDKEWRKHWVRQKRRLKRELRRAVGPNGVVDVAMGTVRDLMNPLARDGAEPGYQSRVMSGLVAPVFGIVHAALFLVLMLAVYSLARTGLVFGMPLPSGVPLWVGFVIIAAAYHAVVSPLSFIRDAPFRGYGGPHGLYALWGGLIWLAFVLFLFWLAYSRLPLIRELIGSVTS